MLGLVFAVAFQLPVVMMLLARGSRPSVQPVTTAEWRHILKMGGARSKL